MRIILSFLLTLLLALPAMGAERSGDLIRHIRPATATDTRNEYFLSLLRLALEKTREEFGDYRLEEIEEDMTQGRAISLLSEGRSLDVIWTMTSKAREEKLRPVRVPLLRGLMGMRLMIIRASDQDRFSHITGLSGLRELRAGQGHDWPDADILRANGLPLATVSNYEALFRMLEEGRIDYLPRAVNEPWEEVAAFPQMELSVEENLLLYYPAASYFFVAPDDERLARRLRLGLQRALEDGSFVRLFRTHPINRHAFGKAELLGRRLLRLHNPLLPEDTPLDNPELWWLPRDPLEKKAGNGSDA